MEDVTKMPTSDIIMLFLAGTIALVNSIIIWYLKSSASERKEDRERLIRIETRLEGLDTMRNDIQSNRHKAQAALDATNALTIEVANIKAGLDSIKNFCNKQHLGNL